MATLTNPNHELFAQELAKGKPRYEAYVAAGYAEKSARQSACKLLQQKPEIWQRVDELLSERKDANARAAEAAASALRLDAEWVLAQLMSAYAAGMTPKKAGGVDNLNGAIRALELIGKHLGMFADRVNVGGGIESWLKKLAEEDAKLEDSDSELSPSTSECRT